MKGGERGWSCERLWELEIAKGGFSRLYALRITSYELRVTRTGCDSTEIEDFSHWRRSHWHNFYACGVPVIGRVRPQSTTAILQHAYRNNTPSMLRRARLHGSRSPKRTQVLRRENTTTSARDCTCFKYENVQSTIQWSTAVPRRLAPNGPGWCTSPLSNIK